jgi:hypothetical protein
MQSLIIGKAMYDKEERKGLINGRTMGASKKRGQKKSGKALTLPLLTHK